MQATPTEITYDEADHVGVITLNRPDARNALTFTTYAELEDAVRSTSARCLVITGADPAFCSGDDVKVIMKAAGEQISSGLRAEPRLTPAADALLTGRIIDAATAKDLRLVSRVVPHDELMPTAMALANEIASNPPLAVQRMK